MLQTNDRRNPSKMLATAAISAAFGLTLGLVGGRGLAEATGPAEHKGLTVEAAGLIPEASMTAQIGLTGYVLQLREITIEPGGQIAQHDHASRPGLVKVTSGTVIEGRPDGEMTYTAGDQMGILEDKDTVHWAWNRGDEPATILVCDIVPAP
jgi:quercetin dioxygenase-like cupin family protein